MARIKKKEEIHQLKNQIKKKLKVKERKERDGTQKNI